MVLRLTSDVLNGGFHSRLAYAEGVILLLPRKQTVFGECLMHPFGRTTFDQLKRLGNGQRCRQRKQEMDVIFDPANFDGFHFVLARNASQKGPESLGERGVMRGRRSLVLKMQW